MWRRTWHSLRRRKASRVTPEAPSDATGYIIAKGNKPDFSCRYFFTLRPGESFRWYRNNDGGQNDVWYVRKTGYFKHPLTAEKPTGCDVRDAYLMNRFQPECANGFVIYEGRTPEADYAVDGAARAFRRSLFVCEDIRAGEIFTERNIRSIRPGCGCAPDRLRSIVGRRAKVDLARGTPMREEYVA